MASKRTDVAVVLLPLVVALTGIFVYGYMHRRRHTPAHPLGPLADLSSQYVLKDDLTWEKVQMTVVPSQPANFILQYPSSQEIQFDIPAAPAGYESATWVIRGDYTDGALSAQENIQTIGGKVDTPLHGIPDAFEASVAAPRSQLIDINAVQGNELSVAVGAQSGGEASPRISAICLVLRPRKLQLWDGL